MNAPTPSAPHYPGTRTRQYLQGLLQWLDDQEPGNTCKLRTYSNVLDTSLEISGSANASTRVMSREHRNAGAA